MAAKPSLATTSDVDKSRGMAGTPLLVLLEIGQSPQPEMEPEFRQVLGESCDILTWVRLTIWIDREQVPEAIDQWGHEGFWHKRNLTLASEENGRCS